MQTAPENHLPRHSTERCRSRGASPGAYSRLSIDMARDLLPLSYGSDVGWLSLRAFQLWRALRDSRQLDLDVPIPRGSGSSRTCVVYQLDDGAGQPLVRRDPDQTCAAKV